VSSESATGSQRQLFGYLALGVAALITVAAAVYVFTSGDDGPAAPMALPGASIDGMGAPTPVPNTGVLSSNRPAIGQPAPDFALVDARDTTSIVKLSDFRGRAVVLNWYASWCGPCKEEIPDFQEAQDALADEVVFLGVNYLESQSRAIGILDLFFATYPAVLDSRGEVAEHYRVMSMPTTFFIDTDGILRSMKTGLVTKQDLQKNLAAVGVDYTP
jgi:cytochrome c biogenesis protein CcmG, thiol:disulfide interchange protein DsbE